MEPRGTRYQAHHKGPHTPNSRTCVGMATPALREGHHRPWDELSVTHSDSKAWATKPRSLPTLLRRWGGEESTLGSSTLGSCTLEGEMGSASHTVGKAPDRGGSSDGGGQTGTA